jgi:hypothetical protein
MIKSKENINKNPYKHTQHTQTTHTREGPRTCSGMKAASRFEGIEHAGAVCDMGEQSRGEIEGGRGREREREREREEGKNENTSRKSKDEEEDGY